MEGVTNTGGKRRSNRNLPAGTIRACAITIAAPCHTIMILSMVLTILEEQRVASFIDPFTLIKFDLGLVSVQGSMSDSAALLPVQ